MFPPGVDPFFERLLVSDRYRVTRQELETYWTVGDALKAHLVLDAFDDAQALADDRAKRKDRPNRRR